MRRVFVDTGALYAALNRKDTSHFSARRFFLQARKERWFLFTTNFVVAETHALILIRIGRAPAWRFLHSVYTGRMNIIRVEEADELHARRIIEEYKDKAFSYCDTISFVVMERLRITEAMAFDDHFRQYGRFTIL